jgi:hypothetical protein
MAVDRLTLYAEIETAHYSKIETYLKHPLQGYRWTDGEGRELYKAPRHVIDEAVTAARHRAEVVCPSSAQAAELTAQESDGTVLTPDQAVIDLYHERMRLKGVEWAAKHEDEGIDAELQVLMGTASEMKGVATFASSLVPDFDEAGFRRDHGDLWQAYQVMRPQRQFRIVW